MTDYSKMSDFEINLSVAKLTINYDDLSPSPLSGTPVVQWGDGSNWHHFDPCNSWADAGPIISSNRIMLNPYCADELWKAEIPVADDGFMKTYAVNYNANPLRAAMIVFLIMNEAE